MMKRVWTAFFFFCFLAAALAQSTVFDRLSDRLATAKQQGKPLLLFLTSENGVLSKKFEAEVFSDSQVTAALSSYVVARINADGPEGAQVRADYGWSRAPLLAILNNQGEHFDVLDLSSVSESLINANLVSQVSTWLEKGMTRFHTHGQLGYIQSPVPAGDPILKTIADAEKNPDLPQSASACLLDEDRIEVREDGGYRSHKHKIWLLHARSPYTTPSSTFLVYKPALDTGWKLIRARTLVPVFGENFYVQNAVDPGEVQESAAYPDFPSLDKLQIERIVMPGVRDGSLLEVEWESEYDPQMPGHFNYTWLVDHDNYLILDSRLRIEAPSDLGIDYRSYRLSPVVKEESTGGNTVFTWVGRSEHAHPRKTGRQVQQETASSLVFASRTTWEEIGDWFLSLTESCRVHNSALDSWIADAMRGVPKEGNDYPRRAVTALQKALHRDFRYLSVNMNESGCQPHPILDTFHNKYGDCKDLALFLQECLRKVGVESDLVLVRMGDREDLQKQLPRTSCFNHVIIRVEDPDGPFFADGTVDLPGGVLPLEDQGIMGLLCQEKKSALVSVDTADAAHEGMQLSLTFENLLDETPKLNADFVFEGATKQKMLAEFNAKMGEEAVKDSARRFVGDGIKDAGGDVKVKVGEEGKPLEISIRGTARDVLTPSGDLLIAPTVFFAKSLFVGLPADRNGVGRGFYSGQGAFTMSLNVLYDLPPGVEPVELPAPLHVDTSYFTVDRKAEREGAALKISTCIVHKLVREASRFVPEKELGAAAQGLQEKLTQPILLRRSSGRDLLEAARKGDLTEVTTLVEQGADLEQADEEGRTPLILAAMEGYDQVVSYLVSKGAKLEAQNHFQATALDHACWKNRAKAAMVLLNAGAECNGHVQDGATPMIFAASVGNEEIAAALLEHKADINATSPSGTALTWAIFHNQPRMVDFLLAHGADPSVATVPVKGNSVTPLGEAASCDRGEILETLIEHGADVNGAGKDDETPLMWAARSNKPASIEALLAHGAKIDLQDQDGDTALFLAAWCGSKEAAAALIAHKADLNAKNLAGRTALMQVCSGLGNAEMVHLLVEAGADLNVKDSQGDTALLYAGNSGNVELVSYLKGKGAAEAPLHILAPEKRKDPLPAAQAWALATCAIAAQQAGLDHQFLGGHDPRTPQEVRAALRKELHLNTKQDLLDFLTSLDRGNDRDHVLTNGAAMARMSDAEFDSYIHGPSVTEKRAAYLKSLRAIYQHWQDRTSLGYDLCSFVAMAEQGFTAGYLSEEEAWNLILPVARKIQNHFDSWQEMGQNYLDGLALSQGKPDPRFEACYQLLLNRSDPNSPWRLPWKTDLGTNP